MNQTNQIYRILMGLSGVLFAAILVMILLGYGAYTGIPLILAFAVMAIGVRGTETLNGYSFTFWVFAAVAWSMYYPDMITEVRGYNTEGLIVPLIQLIMFGMGTSMSLKDFAGVAKMPKGVLVGLVCQFTIMPTLGISLALVFGFPAEIAAGVVLIGSSPSGVASNVMVFLAKGNLALSITLTAVGTLMAPIMTPFLMQTFAGQFVPIDFISMMWSIVNMIILPIAAGLAFNYVFKGKAQWLHKAMPTVSMAGIVIIIAVITASGRDHLMTIGILLIIVAIIHNLSGYFLGYWGCRLFGMNRIDCRTIAFEVGMQNGGMASGIAVEMGRAATMGLAPAVFGPWMNVSGSALANYWRDKAIEEQEGEPREPARPEGADQS